jgi:hypothetical protein
MGRTSAVLPEPLQAAKAKLIDNTYGFPVRRDDNL